MQPLPQPLYAIRLEKDDPKSGHPFVFLIIFFFLLKQILSLIKKVLGPIFHISGRILFYLIWVL